MASSVNFGTQQYFGFDPRTIAGCQLWLDAADRNVLFTDSAGTTLVGSSGNIGMWRDKSVSARHYIQTTSGNRPSFANNTVTCSTTSQILLNSSGLGITGIDIFIVGRPLPSTAGNWRTLFRGSITDHIVILENAGTRLGYFANGASPDFNPFGSLTLDGSTRALIYVTIPANRVASGSLNGTLAVSSGTSAMSSSANFEGLGNWQGGGQPWGDINEVILVSNTTTFQRQQIEGYLAWKWSLTTSAGIVSPSAIPNLKLWVDATDPYGNSTLPANNTTITSWTDKSLSGNSLTGVNSPVWLASPPRMSMTSSAYFTASGPTSYNMIAFFVYIDSNVDQCAPTYTANDPVNSDITGIFANCGGTTYVQTSNNWATQTSTIPKSIVNILSLEYSSATNTNNVKVYFNGVLNFTASSSPFTRTSFTLGRRGGNYMSGAYYESLFYDRVVSDTERQQIEGYLAWKWGLQTNLPSTHPYDAQFALPVSHPYSTRPPVMRVFNPSDIDSCCLWLDALDGDTFTPANPSSGTTITAWRDKSSDAMSCTPVVGASGRTITYRTTTGYPSVFINNANNNSPPTGSQCYINVPNNIQNGFSDFTCIAVVNFQATSTAGNFALQTVYANSKGTSGETRLQIGLGNTFEFNTTTSAPFSLLDIFSDSNVRARRLIMTTSSTSTGIRQFLDGYLWQGDTFISGSRFTTDTGITPRIGATALDGRATTGDFYEMICYNKVITDAERINVEAYLANKWNITRAYTYTSSNTQLLLPNDSSINTNLGLWNDATSYSTNQTLTTWVNRTGGTASTCTGSVVVNQLNGNPLIRLTAANTFASFNMNYSSYTMLFVARYNGTGNTGRIFQGGSGQNIIYGYWNSNKAVLFVENNPVLLDTAGQAKQRNNLWDLVSQRRTANGPFNMRWNQIQIYNGSTSANLNLTTLNINSGGSPSETSACDVAEVIVYNTYLTDNQVIQIENYLNAKWNVVPRNFYAGIASPPARSVYPLFVPSQLSGLQLWLDAADSSTFTYGVSAPFVSAWRDKSGNNFNLSNTTGLTTRQPQVTTSFNNRQMLRWLGSPNGLSNILSNTSFSLVLSNCHVIFAGQGLSNTNGFYPGLISIGTGSGNESLSIDGGNPGPTSLAYRLGFYGNFGGNNIPGSVPFPYGIYGMNVSNNSGTLFQNATSISNATYSFPSTNQTNIGLGMRFLSGAYQNTGNANSFDGLIGEVILYDRPLSPSERQQVEGYLAWKWGLQTNIPTTHPYYKLRA